MTRLWIVIAISLALGAGAVLALQNCPATALGSSNEASLLDAAHRAWVRDGYAANRFKCDAVQVHDLPCLICSGWGGDYRGGPIFAMDCDWSKK